MWDSILARTTAGWVRSAHTSNTYTHTHIHIQCIKRIIGSRQLRAAKPWDSLWANSFIFIWGNWGKGNWSHLPKVTQLVSHTARKPELIYRWHCTELASQGSVWLSSDWWLSIYTTSFNLVLHSDRKQGILSLSPHKSATSKNKGMYNVSPALGWAPGVLGFCSVTEPYAAP